MFEVRWDHSGQHKMVSRLNLLLASDTPELFAQRTEAAKARRSAAQSSTHARTCDGGARVWVGGARERTVVASRRSVPHSAGPAPPWQVLRLEAEASMRVEVRVSRATAAVEPPAEVGCYPA